jgi:hypothetical protein
MAAINKKRKSPVSVRCVGCDKPKSFVFEFKGSLEAPAFWNADAIEQILTQAIDKGLERITRGALANTIEYRADVFEDRDFQ